MELRGKIIKDFMYTHVGQSLGYFVMIPENGNYQGKSIVIDITVSTRESNNPKELTQNLEVSVTTEKEPLPLNAAFWAPDCDYLAEAKHCKILIHA